MAAEPGVAPNGRLTIGLALAASAGLLAALTVVRYLPTHDGPQHIFLAHLENHFSDSGATYSDYYTPTTALTSKGFSLLYAPLAELLEWRSAVQVALAVIVLTWAWGALSFTNAVSRGRRLLGLAGFATAFQWSLYMGFFSFLLSTGIGLFTLAIAFGSAEWPWKRRASIGALLFVQAICHVFAAEVVGLTLLVLVVCRHWKGGLVREVGWLAAMGLPTALIAAHAAGWIGSSAIALPDFQAQAVWPSFTERIDLFATAFTAGPWWRAWPPIVLGVAGVAYAVRRTMKRATTAEDRALLVTSGILGIAALALPLHSRQWEFMSVRFIPMAVVFAIALLPVETLQRRAAQVVHGAVVVMTVTAIAWAGWHNKRLERACGPALAGLDAGIKRTGPRLPIILDPACNALSEKKVFGLPDVEPLLNAGALYAVQQGGVVPYAFVGIPQLHSFVLTRGGFRRFPDVPDRKKFWGGLAQSDPVEHAAFREMLLTSLAISGSRYQDIIFYGTAEDSKQLSRRGYDTDFVSNGLWIGHYRGCPLKLEVHVDRPPAGPLLVQYGWQPFADPAESRVVTGAPPTDDGTIVVELKSAPCGPTWVRAGLARGPSEPWKPGDGHCEGAGEDGKLTFERTADKKSERCELRLP